MLGLQALAGLHRQQLHLQHLTGRLQRQVLHHRRLRVRVVEGLQGGGRVGDPRPPQEGGQEPEVRGQEPVRLGVVTLVVEVVESSARAVV